MHRNFSAILIAAHRVIRWCVLAGSSVSALGLLWSQATSAAPGRSFLDVDLLQNRYFGEAPNPSQNTDYTFLSGTLNLEAGSHPFHFKLNSLAAGSLEAKDEFYFGVPEAYAELKEMGPGFHLTVGRQKRHWSRLDEEFNLGIWQPQLRWDYLAPKQQGLIGIFLDWSISENLQITFFTSPLFLPDQGPNYHLQNGEFSSSNRWFMQPQSRLSLFQGTSAAKDSPLYFEIDRPSEEAIIMNSSFGLGVVYASQGPLWASLNYAYKPRNQIHLGIECTNCGKLVGSSVEITALIHPAVVKHHVLTLETGFERTDDRGWISVTGDFPSRSSFPVDYEEAPLYSSVIAGAAYEHYIYPVLGIPSWLKLAYLQTYDLKRIDKSGLTDSDQVQSSLDRYPYHELAVAEWRIRFRDARRSRFEFSNRYNYSIPEKGGWLSTAIAYTQSDFTYSFGVDILGSDVDANSPQAGLFTRYRSNDRVYGGVGYVF